MILFSIPKSGSLSIIIFAYIGYQVIFNNHWSTIYQIGAAYQGIVEIFSFPQEDIDGCIAAYKYLQQGTSDLANKNSDSEIETEHVRKYYLVLQPLLRIGDIEKMYIPPQIDPKKGLYENQLLHEKQVFEKLDAYYRGGRVGGEGGKALGGVPLSGGKSASGGGSGSGSGRRYLIGNPDSHLLDIGCGSGRIAHHAADVIGGKVSGFNIDGNQIKSAVDFAEKIGWNQSRLEFKVGDHHKRFEYSDNSFDASFSFQALWPFIKINQLDSVAREVFRVLKPGGIYGCEEYLLTPEFDKNNEYHMHLHNLYLPTLAATQSNYPKDVTDALERAGFEILMSAPSVAPAWPLTDQKTDLFLVMRQIVIWLYRIGILPQWMETLVNNLLLGGTAWSTAEKAKLADLNWQIFVRKPYIDV